jgi:hypothetical protein
MKTRSIALLAALLPLAAPRAQEQARAPEPAQEVLPAKTLQEGYDAAQAEWTKQMSEASRSKDQDAQKRLRATRPEALFTPKFLAGATAHAGTEAAVPYLVWLVSRGNPATSKQAVATLIEKHVESPDIRLAVARIGGLKEQYGVTQSREWLDRVLELNQDPDVRAQAFYTRAAMYVGTRAADTTDALRRYAIADLRASLAWIGAVEGSDARSLRGLCESLLDEAKRLEPGLVAPEIAGADLKGVPFKLSDYRGKVVMLDFWGDW